ncbi:unnamed protein product, partial [Iphiclides podalirius]
MVVTKIFSRAFGTALGQPWVGTHVVSVQALDGGARARPRWRSAPARPPAREYHRRSRADIATKRRALPRPPAALPRIYKRNATRYPRPGTFYTTLGTYDGRSTEGAGSWIVWPTRPAPPPTR